MGRGFVVIYAELPGIGEHEEHDKDPRSKAYLGEAGAPQPECLFRFGGGILFLRGS
jgi:hypothetical protein